jgi:hypothetical protein
MDSMRCALALLAVAIMPFPLTAQQTESPAESPERQVLLTVYSVGSAMKLPFGGGPGIQPWYSHLWVDGRKITFIRRGQFLTLRLPEGDHSLAGETNWGHESDAKTVISIHGEQRCFARLTSKSNGLPYAPVHHFAEQVTCREAYDEASRNEPVKLKHIEKSEVDKVARETYFPECGK